MSFEQEDSNNLTNIKVVMSEIENTLTDDAPKAKAVTVVIKKSSLESITSSLNDIKNKSDEINKTNKENNKKTSKNIENLEKQTEGLTKQIKKNDENSTNGFKSLKDATEKKADELGKKLDSVHNLYDAASSFFKGDYKQAFHSLTQNMPKWMEGGKLLLSGVEKWWGLQTKNLEDFERLHNSGVVLTESYTKLYDYANQIGISKDALVEGMIKYSQQVSNMGGLFGAEGYQFYH